MAELTVGTGFDMSQRGELYKLCVKF